MRRKKEVAFICDPHEGQAECKPDKCNRTDTCPHDAFCSQVHLATTVGCRGHTAVLPGAPSAVLCRCCARRRCCAARITAHR